MTAINYGKLTQVERDQINADVLAKVTVNQGYVDAFKAVLKGWRSEWGSKPTPQMLTAAVLLTNKHKRPGVECLYSAMLWRPEGCVSQTEYQLAGVLFTGEAVGKARNKATNLITAKIVHETQMASMGRKARLHWVFMPAGIKALEQAQGAQVTAATPNQPVKAKPAVKAAVKAKGKAKAKKAKPVPAEVQPVTVTPETNATPELLGGVGNVPVTEVSAADMQALADKFNS